jgi:hypothetical protein
MGYYSYTPCEVLAAQALSSTVGLIGYGIGLPFDFFAMKGSSRPSLAERQAFVSDADNQSWIDIGVIQSAIIFAISTILGILAVIYGYDNQQYIEVLYAGVIGPMYTLSNRALIQLLSQIAYGLYANQIV